MRREKGWGEIPPSPCSWKHLLRRLFPFRSHGLPLTNRGLVLAPGGGVTPLYGLCRYVWPKGYGLSAILVIGRVWFLNSCLEMGMFLRRSYFSVIVDKTINKSPSQIMFIAI